MWEAQGVGLGGGDPILINPFFPPQNLRRSEKGGVRAGQTLKEKLFKLVEKWVVLSPAQRSPDFEYCQHCQYKLVRSIWEMVQFFSYLDTAGLELRPSSHRAGQVCSVPRASSSASTSLVLSTSRKLQSKQWQVTPCCLLSFSQCWGLSPAQIPYHWATSSPTVLLSIKEHPKIKNENIILNK